MMHCKATPVGDNQILLQESKGYIAFAKLCCIYDLLSL